MEKDFIDIQDKVHSAFEAEQESLFARFQEALFGEEFLDAQIELLENSKDPERTYQKVRYKEIDLAGFYIMGWDGARHDSYHNIPKALYKWDKAVLSEIEKQQNSKTKAELVAEISQAAVEEYTRGAADALLYFWLKRERKKLGTASAQAENVLAPQAIKKPLLQWNVNTNILVTLFYDLVESGAITYNGKKTNGGAKAEIERMLKDYFVDSKGEILKDQYIKKVLKPEDHQKNEKRENKTGKSANRIDISKILPLLNKKEKS